jgi:two-component SAPR family response regulator
LCPHREHAFQLHFCPDGHDRTLTKLDGMDAEAVACHIKQRFPNLPIILLSAYSELPERILWLVDEYVMRSELPEGLVRIIERVTQSHRLALRSNEPGQRSRAAA